MPIFYTANKTAALPLRRHFQGKLLGQCSKPKEPSSTSVSAGPGVSMYGRISQGGLQAYSTVLRYGSEAAQHSLAITIARGHLTFQPVVCCFQRLPKQQAMPRYSLTLALSHSEPKHAICTCSPKPCPSMSSG